MNHQSFTESIVARSRQLFQKLWEPNYQESLENSSNKALSFLEEYHCPLFPKQTVCHQSEEIKILPLKVRAAELILRQIYLYYLPYRLESLLHHCDPFTAVGTFLNALNFSYETLLQNPQQQQRCQAIFKELMEIEQYYELKSTQINEFPLYEAAASQDLDEFHNTAFAFKRTLDIIDILEQVQPRNYQKQKQKLLQAWHQQKIQHLEKIIQDLTQ